MKTLKTTALVALMATSSMAFGLNIGGGTTQNGAIHHNNFGGGDSSASANSSNVNANINGNHNANKNTNRNTNRNNNSNVNANTNLNANSNVNKNSNTNRNVNDNRSNAQQAQGQKQGQGQLQGQGQGQGQSQGTEVNIDSNDTYEATDGNDWAPTIMAPSLATGTCLGSASGGVSVPGAGFTFGSTTTDEECQIRYNSIRLEQLGMKSAAVVIMCQTETARLALEQTGYVCPSEDGNVGGGGSIGTGSGNKPAFTPIYQQR